MRAAIIKICALLFAVAAGIYGTLKLTTDLVGRTTFWADLVQLAGKFGAMISWLAEQPALVFYWIPIALMLTALALAFHIEIGKVLVGAGKQSKEQIVHDLGGRCLKLAQDIEVYIQHWSSHDKNSANKIWARYLPIATEIEELGLETPPGAFEFREDFTNKHTYLQFVGNLLMNNQMKIAKETAKNLSVDLNQSA